MSRAPSCVAARGATVSEDAEAAPASASRLLPRGTTVGRYVVVDFIGAGGMGSVYAAYDFALDRRACLKFVRDGGGSSAR